MRVTKLNLAGALVVASLVLTACGGGGTSGPRKRSNVAASRPSLKFVVTLTGRAEPDAGAPSGRGVAVIALHDAARDICWRFTHLHGFANATHAEIRRGARWTTGPSVLDLSGASRLHHRGCARASPSLIAAIAARPDLFYVNIAAAGFRSGAVRGQL